MTEVVLVAAMDRLRGIGLAGALPWSLPDDLKRFRQLTEGSAIVMGRKTFESIGRPLPKRRNIVLSKSSREIPGVEVVASVEDAMRLLDGEPRIHVIGGGEIYARFLPIADRLELTEVDCEVEADTWFPDFDRAAFHEERRLFHEADSRHAFPFSFVTLRRER